MSTVPNMKGISIAVLMLLICSCVRIHQTIGLEKMTNAGLDHLIAGKNCTFKEVIRVLQLEESNGFMFPAGSTPEFLSYRFLVEKRALFLKVNLSNIVSQAFFADDSSPLAMERVEHMTNAELDGLIAGKNRTFDDVFHELHLEHSK